MTPSMKSDITVIGSGSWATAIVKMLCPNTKSICWYIHEDDVLRHLKKHGHNPRYLSAVNFNTAKLNLTNDINKAVEASEIILLVTPSAFLKSVMAPLKEGSLKKKTVCSAIKGIIPQDNMIVGEFLNSRYEVPLENIVVITGPSHAEEVAMEKLTYLTVASLDNNRGKVVAALLKNHFLRTILSDDIIGTEYAAVLKNIYAITAGICHGLGYGDNFQAVLLSNAANEMNRFTHRVFPNDRDIKSSAYLGDLLVTGYSQFSRNRTLGSMIGKGYPVKNALLEMTMVAEGYYASLCVNELNKDLKADIPIADTVYRILYENQDPAKEILSLTKKLK